MTEDEHRVIRRVCAAYDVPVGLVWPPAAPDPNPFPMLRPVRLWPLAVVVAVVAVVVVLVVR